MNKTKIEWIKNPDGTQGYTWNPITGCLNGCEYCYARKLASGRLKWRYLANQNVAPVNEQYLIGFNTEYKAETDPFYPRFWEDRLGDIPLKPPKGIFVCDMGELFGSWLPRDWQDRVFAIIRGNPQHRFYLLTKQPQNLIKFSPFPDNCWVGVTATSHQMFVEGCLLLGDIKASVKYISVEPLLSWGDYPADKTAIEQWAKGLTLYGIGWVIIGAQTKPYKPPKIEWVEEIVLACDKAGVPVFLKDNLEPLLHGKEPFVGAIDIYPDDKTYELKLRQEMPK
ncbi:hypothetical protein ES708_00767 [subsurface metagenome]